MRYEELDKELQRYVAQPADFEAWAAALEERVLPWVRAQGNKALWDMVLYVSQRMGFVKEKLSREDFARLVIRVCPSLQGEKPETLRASMEKMKGFTAKRKVAFDSLPDTPEVRELHRIYAEVEGLLGMDVNGLTEDVEKSLVDILEEHLWADLSKDKNTLQRIWRNRQYLLGGNIVQPTLSVGHYFFQKSYEQDEPEMLASFEILEKRVTLDDVKLKAFNYQPFRKHRLVIVSPHGFDNSVISFSRSYQVGLIRVNPNGTVTTVVSRSVNDHLAHACQLEQLNNGSMTEPLLVFDGSRFVSLAGLLQDCGIAIDAARRFKAPVLSWADIEALVESLRPRLEMHFNTVQGLERMAEEEGISLDYSELPEGQLGRFNLKTCTITLSTSDFSHFSSIGRRRFSLAHELGHFFLHYQALREQISSFGETEQSLDGMADDEELRWLERQANQFASCLLMPEEAVRALFWQYADYKVRQMKFIYVDEQPCNLKAFHEIVGPLAKEMSVSLQAMKYRLKYLGLLKEEHRTRSVREMMMHTSES